MAVNSLNMKFYQKCRTNGILKDNKMIDINIDLNLTLSPLSLSKVYIYILSRIPKEWKENK